MVTILPIDVDEDFVKSALAQAIALRVEEEVKALKEVLTDLRAVEVVDRGTWHACFDRLATLRETMEPVMEYGKCFEDQHPNIPEDEDEA